MADFRQLALEFVLEDDDVKQTSIAQRAASEIETAPSNTNPVARWVEAVQPWMPGSDDDDAMQGVEETPDWTSRAKALEFLSRTLAVLDQQVLKPSQVKLLIAFFGAMFDVDHKAGIMASATALSRIITMKSFQPSSGRDIIEKVCALKDDFSRQVAKTRLAVCELLHSLVTNLAVASDLQHHEGPSSAFMRNLLQLCQNERDPDCLMVWFDILRSFSAGYPCSHEILEEVYGAFKAYFPITLPRTSQSGLTPEELKLQLRKCFSSNGQLADLALPFLLGKLDQGDGVTVNVKLDVLRTIRACVEEYAHPEQSVTPYVDRVWTSLKYEVRNGEIEDTIWATLEVLKAVATRLQGDELRDFTLTVTRECVSDLSSQMYSTAAGRLLISVLSANACAFVLMVSPVLTHIKENLRHPKSPTHSQDLLKILRIVLETRVLLAEAHVEERDFASTDPVFQRLYPEIYRGPLQKGSQLDSSYDEIKLATEAVQGAGALMSQRAVRPLIADTPQMPSNAEPLLPDTTRAEICEALFSIAARAWHEHGRKAGSDDLINETIKALRRAVEAYPSGFPPILKRGVAVIRESYVNPTPESVNAIQRVSSVLAFVGCSSLRASLSNRMRCFLGLSCALTSELLTAMDKKLDPSVWCALAAGVLCTVHFFKDACQDSGLQGTARRQSSPQEQSPSQSQWVPGVLEKYTILNSMGNDFGAAATLGQDELVVQEPSSVSELRDDFLLVGLFLVRQLYRRATKPVEGESRNGMKALGLSDDFTGTSPGAEHRYLCLISELASLVVGEMSRSGTSLQFEVFFLSLFRDDLISLPPATSAEVAKDAEAQVSWSWLALGPLNVLSFGILKSLLPSGVLRLFAMGVAQQMLIDGTSPMSGHDNARVPMMRAILAVLANKYELEKLEDLMATIEQHLKNALEHATKETSPEGRRRGLDQARTIFTLAGGLLRRCTGRQTRGLLRLLLQAPGDPVAGHLLGRGLEVITAPQPFVTDSIGSVQRPLWMQKVYIDLVKPMIGAAVGASADTHSPLCKTYFGVTVLLMVRHMRFPIYEEDSGAILRIAISTVQNLGIGLDAKAALEVVRNILVEAPDAVQDHLGSLIKICTGLFSTGPSSAPRRPEWLPHGYAAAPDDAEVQAGCGSCALEIVGGLPRLFETRHLLPYAPQVQRELAAACGHGSRDVRKIARSARTAWSDLR